MTYEDIKKGLISINLMLAYDEKYSPEQYAMQKEVLESARECVEKLEKAECKAEDNLCDSCTNIGCMFQSGIKRGSCAFYMPPNIEPDNCGNYIVQRPSVYPKSDKSKIGHWIEKFNDFEREVEFRCSCCTHTQPFETDYCWRCGAKMEQQGERE